MYGIMYTTMPEYPVEPMKMCVEMCVEIQSTTSTTDDFILIDIPQEPPGLYRQDATIELVTLDHLNTE